MFALIGTEIDVYQEFISGPFEEHEEKDIIALFTTEEKAKAYIEKSRLKKPIRESFSSEKPFRATSLLRNCTYAEIEEWIQPEYPIDPEL